MTSFSEMKISHEKENIFSSRVNINVNLIAGTNGNILSLGKYPDKLHGVEYETMRRGLGGSPGNKRDS